MSELLNTCAVVLAAGKGTRMKSEHPKVASLLLGKPLILYVLEHLRDSGIEKICIVVGYKKEEVIEICENFPGVFFVEQKEQLGTGHALLCAEDSLKDFHGNILVACGDVPLISSKTFMSMSSFHSKHKNAVTVLSAVFDIPKGYGRIVRGSFGELMEIVEEKDANDSQKKINEINTGTYIFESPVVFDKLKKINTNNAQKEYYLPDLIKISRLENKPVGALKLDNPIESSGINSPEDLEKLSALVKEGRIAA